MKMSNQSPLRAYWPEVLLASSFQLKKMRHTWSGFYQFSIHFIIDSSRKRFFG